MMRMAERETKMSDRVDSEFDRIKEELGKVPSRVELFNRFDRSLYPHALKKGGPFKDYIGYLMKRGVAGAVLSSFNDNVAGEFIRMVEKTSMQKLYKMPVLLTFFDHDGYRMSADKSDLISSFKRFYSRDGNRVDLIVFKSRKDPENMVEKDWIDLIYKMPVHFLCRPESEFARFISESEGTITLSEELEPMMKLESFREQVLDAIGYRVLHFKYSRYSEVNING